MQLAKSAASLNELRTELAEVNEELSSLKADSKRFQAELSAEQEKHRELEQELCRTSSCLIESNESKRATVSTTFAVRKPF